jgi:hypothetical protein
MPGSQLRDCVDFGAVLTAAALNGAAGTRTATIQLDRRFTRVTVSTRYTYSAATSVTITPTTSTDDLPSASATFDSITAESIAIAAGVATATLGTYVETLTGTASFTLKRTYDVEGCTWLKLVYSGGGSPGAGDLITAKAIGTLVTQ